MEFLILAVALIAVGVSIVVLRNRRPTGIDAGIADFAARRQALAPEDLRPGAGPPQGTATGTDPDADGPPPQRTVRPKTPPPLPTPEPGGRRSG